MSSSVSIGKIVIIGTILSGPLVTTRRKPQFLQTGSCQHSSDCSLYSMWKAKPMSDPSLQVPGIAPGNVLSWSRCSCTWAPVVHTQKAYQATQTHV